MEDIWIDTESGGSQFIATGKNANVSDAINCAYPERRHPSRNSVLTYLDNRSIILFVTVVAEKRRPILATPEMHKIIIEAWKAADSWAVGRYVIMPDHIHFFCAPGNLEGTGFHRWMKHWKSLATIAYRRMGGLHREGRNLLRPNTNTDAINCVPPASVPPAKNPPLFQRDCWDRQLRTGESYSDKWQYVRNNPVRKGLVANAADWPCQGEICQFVWHERI